MNPKVVFFGGPDYGKSTVIGYMYAESQGVDMDKRERDLRVEMGSKYRPDYLFSSLANSRLIENIKRAEEGQGRSNSKDYALRSGNIDCFGDLKKITMIDTPGHTEFFSGREMGMSMSDIGIFCFAIKKVLADDFVATFEYSDLFSQYHPNKKLIYLLTMFDIEDVRYDEHIFNVACDKLKKHCRMVEVGRVETVLGADFSIYGDEIDAAAIIPVAVEFKTEEKEGVNIFKRSSKTPWYRESTLVEAIRMQMQELAISE